MSLQCHKRNTPLHVGEVITLFNVTTHLTQLKDVLVLVNMRNICTGVLYKLIVYLF